VGFLVGRRYGIDARPLGRVIFYIFSPALIFDSLSKNKVDLEELARIVVVMVAFVGCMMLIAFVAGRWRYRDRLARAGIILSAICPNNGNFGLPIIQYAFTPDVLARAVVVYIAVTFLNYSAGIFVASSGQKSARQAIGSIARVPVVYAALAGLVVNTLGMMLPPVLSRSVGLAAQAAVPGMIILLGLQLAQARDFSGFRLVGLGTGLRLLVSPVVAVALVLLFGVQYPASTAIIMQASMPVAVVTIIFAAEYGLEDRQISSTVLTSTLLSPVTLTLLILLLKSGPVSILP
jgi:malate permease and related proteins